MANSTRSSRYIAICLASQGLFLAACAQVDDELRTQAGVARDSAGVRIVEHPSVPEDLPVWSVSETPELRIGSIDVAATAFASVGEIIVRSDGSLVVVDEGAGLLRAFSPSGEMIWVAGGIGGGPGEFGRVLGRAPSLDAFLMPDDSILVFDGSNQRLQVFDSAGTFVRSYSAPTQTVEGASSRPVGVLSDGSLIVRSTAGLPRTGQFERPKLTFERFDHSGAPLGRFGIFEGAMRSMLTIPPGGLISSGVLMAPGTSHATSPARLAIGRQDSWEIIHYALDATPVMIVRMTAGPAAMPDEIRAQILERAPPPPPPPPGRTRAEWPVVEWTVSDILPAFNEIIPDDIGRLWIQETEMLGEHQSSWRILSPSGEFIGRVTIPPDFRVAHIGRDYLLGVTRDSLGVAYVEKRGVVSSGRW